MTERRIRIQIRKAIFAGNEWSTVKAAQIPSFSHDDGTESTVMIRLRRRGGGGDMSLDQSRRFRRPRDGRGVGKAGSQPPPAIISINYRRIISAAR